MGRRKVTVDEQHRWVFNKIAAQYAHRPPYPDALIDVVATRFPPGPVRVLDLGAGTGHMTLPLRRRGIEVTAVEPAGDMLEELDRQARLDSQPGPSVLGTAEDTKLAGGSFGAVTIADALHFMDAELTAIEVRRLLQSRGVLVVVQAEYADTPFMSALDTLLVEHTTRRRKRYDLRLQQFFQVATGATPETVQVEDRRPMPVEALLSILRSYSFVGPAMNEARWGDFERAVRGLARHLGTAEWSRRFEVSWATR